VPGCERLRHLRVAALLAVLAGLILAGCGSSSTSASSSSSSSSSSTSGSTTAPRPPAIVYRPQGLSHAHPVPLIIALARSCTQCMEGTTKFEHLAREHGFVVAYPGSGQNPPWHDPIGDVTYMRSLIDHLVRTENIDPKRVYITGFSATAREAYFMGCQLSDQVAAIAAVSSVMRGYTCTLTHPVSELSIFGTSEPVPTHGTSSIPSEYTTAARWRMLDGCPRGAASSATQVGPVVQQQWGPCAEGSAVALYAVQGGHHAWPGAYGETGSDAPGVYDASQAIWTFFAAHPAASLTGRPSQG
jgi:poly(3-hydroxybutyrate) depolymerase